MGAFLDSSITQHLTASPLTLADAQTISVWVRNDVSGAGQCVLENYKSAFFYQRFESDALVPTARRKRLNPAETVTIGPAALLDTWTHLLFTRSGQSPYGDLVYTDGVAGTGQPTDNNPAFDATALAIGARVLATNPFSGVIAEIGIWSQVVSQATRDALILGARPNSTPEPVDFYASLEFDATVQVGGLTLVEQNGPIDYVQGEFHPTMFDMVTTTALDFDRPPAGVGRGMNRGAQ